MRIALFTETFLPKVDGIVTTLCHVLEHTAAHGHKTLLFAPDGGPTRYADTPVISFPSYPFPLYPELKLAPPTGDVAEHLEAFRPDVVHVLSPTTLGLSGMYHARRLNIPVAASFHTDIPGFMEQWGFKLLSSPTWAMLRLIYNQADLNLCPSQATRLELRAKGFKRTKVWSRGVDTGRFHPRHRSSAWRERLSGGQPDAPLLLFVGRLSPEKRISWLRPVLDALPDVRLAIVGDGPGRAKLAAEFAGTQTVFTGYLRGEDLAQAYASSDLFVFPAANETFGNVVLEAMASGLPVVVARAGGPIDFVQEGQNGLFFEPDSPDDLVESVTSLVRQSTQARRLGVSGRAFAEARSWSSVMDGLIQEYEQLYQENQNGGGRRRKRERRYRSTMVTNRPDGRRSIFKQH